MSNKLMIRSGGGLTISMGLDGWPRSATIIADGNPANRMELFTSAQMRALHFLLGEVIASDPQPDDRPRGQYGR